MANPIGNIIQGKTPFGQGSSFLGPGGPEDCWRRVTFVVYLPRTINLTFYAAPPPAAAWVGTWKGSMKSNCGGTCGYIKKECFCKPLGYEAQNPWSVTPVGNCMKYSQAMEHWSHQECPPDKPCEPNWRVPWPKGCPPNGFKLDIEIPSVDANSDGKADRPNQAAIRDAVLETLLRRCMQDFENIDKPKHCWGGIPDA